MCQSKHSIVTIECLYTQVELGGMRTVRGGHVTITVSVVQCHSDVPAKFTKCRVCCMRHCLTIRSKWRGHWCVCVRVCVCICIYMSVFLFLCVSAPVCTVHTCISLSVSQCVDHYFFFLSVSLCLCVSMSLCLRLCVFVTSEPRLPFSLLYPPLTPPSPLSLSLAGQQ